MINKPIIKTDHYQKIYEKNNLRFFQDQITKHKKAKSSLNQSFNEVKSKYTMYYKDKKILNKRKSNEDNISNNENNNSNNSNKSSKSKGKFRNDNFIKISEALNMNKENKENCPKLIFFCFL